MAPPEGLAPPWQARSRSSSARSATVVGGAPSPPRPGPPPTRRRRTSTAACGTGAAGPCPASVPPPSGRPRSAFHLGQAGEPELAAPPRNPGMRVRGVRPATEVGADDRSDPGLGRPGRDGRAVRLEPAPLRPRRAAGPAHRDGLGGRAARQGLRRLRRPGRGHRGLRARAQRGRGQVRRDRARGPPPGARTEDDRCPGGDADRRA